MPHCTLLSEPAHDEDFRSFGYIFLVDGALTSVQVYTCQPPLSKRLPLNKVYRRSQNEITASTAVVVRSCVWQTTENGILEYILPGEFGDTKRYHKGLAQELTPDSHADSLNPPRTIF